MATHTTTVSATPVPIATFVSRVNEPEWVSVVVTSTYASEGKKMVGRDKGAHQKLL